MRSDDSLKAELERVLLSYHRREYLSSDPISIPHRYPGKLDREMVSFLSAMMAFGNVKSMLPALEVALEWLGTAPVSRLLACDQGELRRGTQGFQYRWVREGDLFNVFLSLREAYRAHGSLEALFLKGWRAEHPNTLGGVASLLEGLRLCAPLGALDHYGTQYLLPSPGGKGAYKRVHLFVRWMVRDDSIDLGLWEPVSPSQCIVPLDTHVARLSRLLGLSGRRTIDGRMALEVTAGLKQLDPADPVKYDFALSRLGILGACPSKRDAEACKPCGLKRCCRHWRLAA